MLLEWDELVKTYFTKPITGVLHVGAHLAEEAHLYDAYGVENVWWVEGNPKGIDKLTFTLRPYPKQRIIQALIFEEDGVQ